jgi:hypothetical protein
MERLQQIEEIFQEALQHDPAERDAYVRQACGATPSYNVRSYLCWQITAKALTPGPQPRQRN